ncbi:MAG: MgtC/SapB family protein [Pigmentiphaga sp.]|nr:MgtC/SapB family protein [Pigmentiphaga sp.]
MQATYHFSISALQDSALSLFTAFVCGTMIGLERQLRQRTAGLRTIALVTVGAALFVDIAARIYEIHGGNQTPVHVVAYVVSGVGFLGAGVIMRDGGGIRGINTAATLWTAAAVGSAAGADLISEAIVGTLFILGVNVVLRPLANFLDRRALPAQASPELREEAEPAAK